MEKNKSDKNYGCGEPEAIVSFIYGELAIAESTALEEHLSFCDDCTAELAELSFARLDVYEWRRDEFAVMETPRIVVPYTRPSTLVNWFVSFRSLFSPIQFATAGGGLAVAAIVLAGWFFMPRAVDLATANVDNAPAAPVNESRRQTPTAGPIGVAFPKTENEARKPETVVVSGREPVKVSAPQPTMPRKASSGTAREQNARQPVRSNIPLRLNDFEDEDDNTLRLGDLLADVDTRD